ncbi:hypothetical protein JG687_00010603 [Phytophthora cactorum]|uniref:Uncharacterized protein n=2 Tax=Phytophthora cactorum TaxID=29920 RepID=A0A329RRQ3_9STRA|nr:Alpha/Beta hydrolase fold [Phytophthora cactorum]KAG2784693.1 hypothetical protein Pcac1_g5765 [Phytophthora cactorum]KAG2906254.1 hypothetical protein PC114_g11222 [Phytophthora cactorum]KAG2915179.1 hypothetical protein PC115_g11460 [Phytophthora cactorum]KAG3014066.1 hypothetical protein PC120_g12931 [Phytophthora cactorum]
MHDQTPLLIQTTSQHAVPSLNATLRRLLAALAVLMMLAVVPTNFPTVNTGLRIDSKMLTQRPSETLLAYAPSLRLHFRLKRSSMDMFGHSEFDVFASPVVSTSNNTIFYNGYVKFDEDSTSHALMLVDGVAYYVKSSMEDASAPETARCLSFNSIPPLNSILPALNSATPIASVVADNDTVTCPRGNLLKTTLSGATFVICSLASDGFTIYGSDLDVSVEYLDSRVDITAPLMDEEQARSCEKVIAASSVTPTTLALLTGHSITSPTVNTPSRNLKAKSSVTLQPSSCACKSTLRPCIFFHGMGETTEKKSLQTSFTSYWGDLADNAPCCSSIQYAMLNTVNYPWTDASLQQKVCNFALSVSNTSNVSSRTIADTIVVTHSMGGLMVGGALANDQCKFATSTTWVALSAPMTGSIGSDYLQETCNGTTGFLRLVALLIGRCPANNAVKAMTYESDPRTTSALKAAYISAQTAFRKHVSAVMCSYNYAGLFSKWQPIYQLAGSIIPHKSKENDGIVEFKSCAGGLPAPSFGRRYVDAFYLTGLNHVDTTFRNGDGFLSTSRKPIKWFECLL